MAGDTVELLQALKEGDRDALAPLFDRYRDQLQRIVESRLGGGLKKRVDASDVIQQSYVEAQNRIQHFVQDGSEPFFGWLRQIALQTLIDLHRRHVGTKKRDVRQEVSLHRDWNPNGNSGSFSDQLIADLTSPSHAAIRDERAVSLREAINSMDPIDREVLALRHFDELSNKRVAEILGIEQAAASNRYIRALKRLKDILDDQSIDS